MQKQQVYRYTTTAPAIRRAYPARPRQPRSMDHRYWLAAAGLLLALGLFFGLTVGGYYLYFSFSGRIVPGAHVLDISLSGLTAEQAAARLEEAWGGGPVVTLSDGQRTWSSSADALGFRLDAQATAQLAAQAGRTEGGWLDPFALVRRSARTFQPVVTLEPSAAQDQLRRAITQINIAPQEASVRFNAGQWQALPGKAGLAVDIDQTVTTWLNNPRAYVQAGLLPLKMVPVAPAVMDTSAQAAELNQLLGVPLKMRAFDPVSGETLEWEVPKEELGNWVRVSQGQEGAPSMSLDSSAFSAYLQQWQQGLGGGRYLDEVEGVDGLTQRWRQGQPVTARVRHLATEYTVEAGDNLVSIAFKTGVPFWMIQRANPGVNPNALPAGESITIPSLDENLPLPVVPGKRIVISISQQRLWTYQDGELRTESVISTGIDRSPTMPGIFQIRTHDVNAYASNWDLWMPHFMGIYEAAPGFMNGIHGLPMLSGGRRLWADVLGSKASYGCIILTLEEAEDLFSWAEEGVVVEIQR